LIPRAKEEYTVIKTFVLGAAVGAAVMALYGKQLAAYLEDQTFGLRARAADGLGAVADSVGSVKDAVETVKTRVEDGFRT
jgi:hypothetical protein